MQRLPMWECFLDMDVCALGENIHAFVCGPGQSKVMLVDILQFRDIQSGAALSQNRDIELQTVCQWNTWA